MSGATLAAYDSALSGADTRQTLVTALDAEDFSLVGGCTKTATKKIFPATELRQLVLTGQNAASERAQQDPRVIAELTKWSSCTRSSGYSFGKPDDVRASITAKLIAILGKAPAPLGVGAAAATPVNTAAIAALQQEEITLAAADGQCAAKGLDAVTTTVEAEYEKKLAAGG